MSELILEGRLLEGPQIYGIGFDGQHFYVYHNGTIAAVLSTDQTREMIRIVRGSEIVGAKHERI